MNDQNTASTTRTTARTEGDREIVMERIFDAPREKVYETMIDPELIPQWWAGHKDTTTVDKFDAREGGDWRFVSSGPDTASTRSAARSASSSRRRRSSRRSSGRACPATSASRR